MITTSMRATALLGAALLVTFACAARGDDARDLAGGATGQDSLRPAAAPGEPAASFPTPTRPIADIVAPRWTNEDARDDAGEFARVNKLARVTSGMRVADIGAGDGYYAVRLAPIVGATGRVYANDIVPDYLRLLQNRLRRDPLPNVQLVLGDAHDPRLPTGDVDVAIMIHMYHEIEQPFGLLWNLATAMKPGGRLVILDLDRPTYGHGTPPALLRCELTAVGYREVTFTRSGPEEYVAIFAAPSVAERPAPDKVRADLGSRACRAAR